MKKLILLAMSAALLSCSAQANDMGCLRLKVRLTYPHMEYGDFGRAFVEVFVTNDLPYAIASAQVAYSIRTPGREMAWAEGENRYKFQGGLEPGEQRTAIYYGEYLPSGAKEQPLQVEVELRDITDAKGRRASTGDALVSCHVNPQSQEDM